MRILALVPGGIGDQILFFPTIYDLKEKYPKALIDVIVEPRSKSAYRVCDCVHQVLTFDFKDRNGLTDYIFLIGDIKDNEYDMVVTLGQRWTVGLLLWLSGIPVRVGYKTTPSWFLSNTVELNKDQYAAWMYHDLLKGLGIEKPCPELQVSIPIEDRDWAEAEKKRLDIKESGYIVIHGGSSQMALSKGIDKIYPVPKWQRIVEDSQRRHPEIPIVLLSGPEDEEWVRQMNELCRDLKVTEPPDIGKLAAIIAGANLMLCTDSAPMHLSVAVGTETVALFGPTEASKLLPPNNDRARGVQSPTYSIEAIDPEKVIEQIWRA